MNRRNNAAPIPQPFGSPKRQAAEWVLRRLDLMTEVGRLIVGAHSLDELGAALAEKVANAMQVDACAIRLLEGSKLKALGFHGIPPDGMAPELDATLGIAARILRDREPVTIVETAAEPPTSKPHANAVPRKDFHVFQSYAGAPMILQDDVVGILSVFTLSPRRFDKAELHNLQTIANQVAVAIVNHQLFMELRERNLSLMDRAKKSERSAQLVQRVALFDELTGLPTRTLFLEHAAHALAQRNNENTPARDLAVCYLDCDRFRNVNEDQGRAFGDRLLAEIAVRLRKALRPSDILSRVTGDEFVALMEIREGLPLPLDLAESIRSAFAEGLDLEGHHLHLSLSIGVVPSAEGYEQPDDMIRDAKTAMRQAKNLGGNQTVVFSPILHAERRHLLSLEFDLREAVEHGRIGVSFQPIVETGARRVVGFEALARWFHPVRGPVSPRLFIPIAEENTLIIPLGWHVMRTAIQQAALWSANGTPPPFLSVNLLVRQLHQPGFVDTVDRLLREHDFPPSRLSIEITESMLMSQTHVAIETLSALRDLGVSVWIDDFGTGYSSLSSMHRLPLSRVKVDQSFVERIEDPRGARLLRTIVQMAHNLELSLVSEGVETEEQHQALQSFGIEWSQGFLYSVPLTAGEAAQVASNGLL